jgi:hypothetical protein
MRDDTVTNRKKQNDKQWSPKHYIENSRSSNVCIETWK